MEHQVEVTDVANVERVDTLPVNVPKNVQMMANVVDVAKKVTWTEIVVRNKNVSIATKLDTCRRIALNQENHENPAMKV